MTELRWNPLLREWTAVASHRMDRPQLPRDTCPFCPGSPNVPENYDVLIYPNDFPALDLPPQEMGIQGDNFYRVQPAKGKCDVVLYHPNHTLQPSELPPEHWLKVVRLWKKRFTELAADPQLPYVFIFENKGEVIGVTMPHPHGQIYAFPFIPPKVHTEVSSSFDFWQDHDQCLFCNILERELSDGVRILGQNDHFAAFIPFFARWPYEVHIYPKRHLQTLTQFGEEEEKALAEILKWLLVKYDSLYGFPFPYMMVQHAGPVSGADCSFYHWHIEYYPPQRSPKKLKYLAGVETGSGTFLNDAAVEDKAEELRAAGPADPAEFEIG